MPIMPSEISVHTRPEAVAVVDIVGSTKRLLPFGWATTYRPVLRELRSILDSNATPRGKSILKALGDGYLVTFFTSPETSIAAANALDFARAVIKQISLFNTEPERSSETKHFIRIALHFGEVDVIDGDREGETVIRAFRIESLRKEHLELGSRDVLNAMPVGDFPSENYILCSEQFREMLLKDRRADEAEFRMVGTFSKSVFRGFTGWSDVYRILMLPDAPVAIVDNRHQSSEPGI